MKRPASILALCLLLACPALFATGPVDNSLPPFCSYISIQSGYNVAPSDRGLAQTVPLAFQTGFLNNSDDGSWAMGFGTRIDIDFGIASSPDALNIDTLFGLETLLRPTNFMAVDLLFGLSTSVLDIPDTAFEESVVTLGPGLAAALRFSPPGINVVALDIGCAIYGHFAVEGHYTGFGVTPFVGITIDFSAFPYLYLPHYISHMIIF